MIIIVPHLLCVFSFGFRSAAAGGLEMLQVRGGLGEPV
eukprot:COSAG06_NODE_35220_length_462_cov_7.680441_1_plen_37_part_10